MRVRGLKRQRHNPDLCADRVAPRAGAWIETLTIILCLLDIVFGSHPVRVRGLKLITSVAINCDVSHPRGCVD